MLRPKERNMRIWNLKSAQVITIIIIITNNNNYGVLISTLTSQLSLHFVDFVAKGVT